MKITENTVEISLADYAKLRATAELAFVMVMDQTLTEGQGQLEPITCQEQRETYRQQVEMHKRFTAEFPKIEEK